MAQIPLQPMKISQPNNLLKRKNESTFVSASTPGRRCFSHPEITAANLQIIASKCNAKCLQKSVIWYIIIVIKKGVSILDKVVNVNFRLSATDKKLFESACADMGMSVSTALTIFSKIVGRERRIPFEISADMFYSESNMEHLRRGIAALNAGKGEEHEPIEVEDE